MTHPSEPAPERGEVEALMLSLALVSSRLHIRPSEAREVMKAAITTIASLSAELERLRAARE